MSQQQNNNPSQGQQQNPYDFAPMMEQFLPFVQMFAQFFNQQTPNQQQCGQQQQDSQKEQEPKTENTQSPPSQENSHTHHQNSFQNFPFFFPFNMMGQMFNPQCNGDSRGCDQCSSNNSSKEEQSKPDDQNDEFFEPLFNVLKQLFDEENNENSSLLQDIVSQLIDPSMYYGNEQQQNPINICSIFEILKEIYPQLSQYNIENILARYPNISQKITNLFSNAFMNQVPHQSSQNSNTQNSNQSNDNHCQNQNQNRPARHHYPHFWHNFFNNIPNETNDIVAEEHRERITELDGTVRMITKRSLGEKWFQSERIIKGDQTSSKEIWHNVPEEEVESFKVAWKTQFDKQNQKHTEK
ncbi:hypothetical protein TRFO_05663 [Tritrichomonas foetus]|uniref:Uncharacterized protein n=1 Tax=Tritrichomonas foetus TaxID=1144522 RepID=A0A1J4K4X2_9EUKA|nr:hypothetical protein TRFO_05663 [Tritrichomonas foetus]|eukprot:OHT06026.1 hypothetical protein TRFO_05663 [Tritrichomonas foetus]